MTEQHSNPSPESGQTEIAPTEEWRPAPDFECIYDVSNIGRVKRVGRSAVTGKGYGGGARIGRILREQTLHNGYKVVFLWKNGRQFNTLVHVLVARAFLGPCPEGMEVNHKEGRHKWDNSVGNLEYMTRGDNNRHAYATGLMHRGEDHCHAKLTEDDVRAIRVMHNPSKVGGCGYRQLAKRFKVSRKAIQQVIKGISWDHVREIDR